MWEGKGPPFGMAASEAKEQRAFDKRLWRLYFPCLPLVMKAPPLPFAHVETHLSPCFEYLNNVEHAPRGPNTK